MFGLQLEALEDPVPAVEAIVSRCSKEQVWQSIRTYLFSAGNSCFLVYSELIDNSFCFCQQRFFNCVSTFEFLFISKPFGGCYHCACGYFWEVHKTGKTCPLFFSIFDSLTDRLNFQDFQLIIEFYKFVYKC